VLESVNRAFAQIEVDAALDSPAQLQYNTTSIDVTTIDIKEKVRV
jgi:hypothetical protein